MGTYDTVGNNNVQIKSTFCTMKHYRIGSEIELPNGLHIGYEGWFVVENNKVVCEGETIYDKWGGTLETNDVINSRNPINIVIDEMEKKNRESITPEHILELEERLNVEGLK